MQAMAAIATPSHFATADEPTLRDRAWLEAQWEIGRRRAGEGDNSGALLVLDEVQKIPGWSETVKRLWDEDARTRLPLKVLLLGSAALLMQRGLSESLTGRFELIRVPHWSLTEMREAFGFGLDEYVFFGGYPGAADLITDEQRWASYILDSIIETTISRDVLLLTRVDKPALMRGLLRLVCDYSGRIVAYQKLVGQLQDAGNTTTIAHYLDLLGAAGMAVGLEKYSGSKARQRRSSPKLLALNNALISASSARSFAEARADRDHWGRLIETAVGAHMVNSLDASAQVLYWRDRSREVDFVVERGRTLTVVEVKSGMRRDSLPGISVFDGRYHPRRKQLVGADGIPIDEFLSFPAGEWVA
jgi:predicted AAA+ superfamily ATPase